MKESCTDSIHSGDSGWKRNKVGSFSKSPIQIHCQFLYHCHCHQYKFIVSEKLSAGQYWTLVIVTALIVHLSNTNINQTIILLLVAKDQRSKRHMQQKYCYRQQNQSYFFHQSIINLRSQTRKNGSIGSRVSPTA